VSDKYIAPHITRKEYRCKCCKKFPPDFYFHDGEEVYSTPEIFRGFFSIFEDIRKRWGKSIRISSGYRCPKHNKKEGGELHSSHMFGLALDLDLPSVRQVDQLSYIIEQSGVECRMGVYRISGTFIHLDQAFRIHPRLSANWYPGKRWWK